MQHSIATIARVPRSRRGRWSHHTEALAHAVFGDRSKSRPWLYVFRMPYDPVADIVAGDCGDPVIRTYPNRLAPADRPDIGYAMIAPRTTIVRVGFVDIIPAPLPQPRSSCACRATSYR